MAFGRGKKLELSVTRKQGFAERNSDYRGTSNFEDRRTNPYDTTPSNVFPTIKESKDVQRPAYSPKSPREWDNQVQSREDTNNDIIKSVDDYIKNNFPSGESTLSKIEEQFKNRNN